jgi:hypothetical protein
MPALHDPSVHQSLRSRVERMRPDASRQWGKMTSDQMLRHVNIALGAALGHTKFPAMKMPMPGPVLRFFAYYFPIPKGAPTHPNFIVNERCDFDAEQARCLSLLDEFVRKPIDAAWPDSVFGPATGKFNSHVQAKHVDHHLRQFSS